MTTRMRAEQRREMLLKAALGLFASEGYGGSTTKAIAERTGVTEAILFRHFPTKRDLFYAVLREFGPKRFFRIDREALSADGVTEGLRLLLTEYLEGLWVHRDWVRVLWREARQDELASAEMRKQYRVIGKALTQVLEGGRERGEVEADALPAALQIISLAVRGFVARSARRPPKDWEAARDEFVANLVRVVVSGVAARATEADQT
jgi:AcrR family transcriptional regulator